ncbi:MAG: sugar phosphate nucleotidyltransferase [Myxococcota bacterium]
MSLALRDGVIGTLQEPLPRLLERLDARGVGAMVILDETGGLIGLMRDSLVRRKLGGNSVTLPALGEALDRDPPTIREDALPAEVSELMRDRRSRYAVALDRFGRPVGLFTAHAIPGVAAISEAVIMAGGLGSRLRPFTNTVPKPLLMVGEKPILEVIINHLVRYGIRRIHLAVNYHSEKIKEYFQDGSNHKVEIRYIEEKEALGTAGALRLLQDRVSDGPLLVMNGDLLTGVNVATLSDVHELEGAAITLSTTPNRVDIPYGVVGAKDMRLEKIEEKPTLTVWINAGIYVLGKRAIDAIPKEGPADMPSVITKLMGAGDRVAVFPMRESWLDIGQLHQYQRAIRDAIRSEGSEER